MELAAVLITNALWLWAYLRRESAVDEERRLLVLRIQAPQLAVSQASADLVAETPRYAGFDSDEEYWNAREERLNDRG